jgi:predicted Ser/Thr protein kinase
MGVVYQAIDPTIGRTLAIKTIRLREVDDPAQRDRLKERLFLEARSAGVLSHSNIVTIYDMEEDDGVAYIAMQFVNGPTLDEVMSRPKAMGAQELFRVLRQTASALDFAHAKGIVHRDIKPANIMIDEHGTAKITDFGIAKVGTSGNLTLSGTILGTPNYMSPEQVQGKLVDGRADQFSLAVVAYEILTGDRPFAGEHLGTVVYKIVAEEPAVVHRLNPSLSPDIDGVIRKALSKKADGRYKNCIDFVNALEGACLQAEGWQSLARGTSHSIPTEAEPASRTRAPKPERTAGRRKPVAALGSSRASSRDEGTRDREKTSMFFPAFGAFVVVLGVLAMLGWQSGLWEPANPSGQGPSTVAGKAADPEADLKPEILANGKNEDVETPPAKPVELKTSEPAQGEAAKPEASPTMGPAATRKPSPAEPKATQSMARKAAKAIPEAKASPRIAVVESAVPTGRGTPQDLFIQTNPSGVTAVVDNRADTACETPCVLLAAPGVHLLSLTLPNFQKEIRQIRVAESRVDVPLITMHPNGGTLMISTVPQGANIFIDDRLMGSMTPAQISLPGGTYNIKVELNGMRKSERIEVSNGNTKYLKMTLNP